MSPPDQSPGHPDLRKLRVAGISFLALILAIFAYGVVSRAAQNSRLHDLTEAEAVPNVAVVTPSGVANNSGLELPGRLEAFIRR